MTAAYVGRERHDIPDAGIIARVAQQLGGSFDTAVLAVILAGAATGAGLGGQILASRRRVPSRSCKPIATATATKQMAAMTA
jgi:hypothetical protein